MWLAYMIGEWTEGTVITPMKVVQARLRESLRPAYETQKLEENLPLSPALHLLLKRYVTVLSGCAFASTWRRPTRRSTTWTSTNCTRWHKLHAVAECGDSEPFSAAGRAVLFGLKRGQSFGESRRKGILTPL